MVEIFRHIQHFHLWHGQEITIISSLKNFWKKTSDRKSVTSHGAIHCIRFQGIELAGWNKWVRKIHETTFVRNYAEGISPTSTCPPSMVGMDTKVRHQVRLSLQNRADVREYAKQFSLMLLTEFFHSDILSFFSLASEKSFHLRVK